MRRTAVFERTVPGAADDRKTGFGAGGPGGLKGRRQHNEEGREAAAPPRIISGISMAPPMCPRSNFSSRSGDRCAAASHGAEALEVAAVGAEVTSTEPRRPNAVWLKSSWAQFWPASTPFTVPAASAAPLLILPTTTKAADNVC